MSSSPNPPETIRVAVVEDDSACRMALAHALQAAPDMRVQWLACSRAEALDELAKSEPLDVLVLDLGLPDGSGLDVLAALRARWPEAMAMVSTIFGDEENVLRSIEAGAMGYLLKDLSAQALVEEIRSLRAGGSPINPMVARKLLMKAASLGHAGTSPAPPSAPPAQASNWSGPPLSAREAEVLRLVARGYTVDEVADELNVSRHTVRTFVRRIYDKLQVSSRAEAVREGERQGWLHEKG
ncbi:MAG: response regulator transcription factor [Ottowia sp.]|uniref:response regulator n=1 Tax=Ottowia sp. TaxID=1898956 RepID=UPI003C728EA7